MKRIVILASVVVLAAASANCGNSDRNVLSPSSLNDSADATAAARGGGGKGKTGGGGSTGGSGSLSIVMLSDPAGNGPSYGDRITFNVTTTATSPFVRRRLLPGLVLGLLYSVGYFDAYPWAKEFTLSAKSWPGGAADCTAKLYTSWTVHRRPRWRRFLSTLPSSTHRDPRSREGGQPPLSHCPARFPSRSFHR